MRSKQRHRKKKEPKEMSDSVQVALIGALTTILLKLIDKIL
jgi:hypothetical protein